VIECFLNGGNIAIGKSTGHAPVAAPDVVENRSKINVLHSIIFLRVLSPEGNFTFIVLQIFLSSTTPTFFSDEAWFHLSRFVTSQNYTTRSARDPHNVMEVL
jgi:hypothetical protein